MRTTLDIDDDVLQAAKEIASTDEPVKSIASAWGFTDQSHLHRLFVQIYGITPSEHRRAARMNG